MNSHNYNQNKLERYLQISWLGCFCSVFGWSILFNGVLHTHGDDVKGMNRWVLLTARNEVVHKKMMKRRMLSLNAKQTVEDNKRVNSNLDVDTWPHLEKVRKDQNGKIKTILSQVRLTQHIITMKGLSTHWTERNLN